MKAGSDLAGVGVWEAGPALFLAGNGNFRHASALDAAPAEAALGGEPREELRPTPHLGAASA